VPRGRGLAGCGVDVAEDRARGRQVSGDPGELAGVPDGVEAERDDPRAFVVHPPLHRVVARDVDPVAGGDEAGHGQVVGHEPAGELRTGPGTLREHADGAPAGERRHEGEVRTGAGEQPVGPRAEQPEAGAACRLQHGRVPARIAGASAAEDDGGPHPLATEPFEGGREVGVVDSHHRERPLPRPGRPGDPEEVEEACRPPSTDGEDAARVHQDPHGAGLGELLAGRHHAPRLVGGGEVH